MATFTQGSQGIVVFEENQGGKNYRVIQKTALLKLMVKIHRYLLDNRDITPRITDITQLFSSVISAQICK